MPKYKKKITRLMEFDDFKREIEQSELTDERKAFLTVLYFSGCRVSEALALTSNDVSCASDTIYVQFFRLKGSKQTDPIPLPRAYPLTWLCHKEGELFPFCRTTAYRLVKKVFAELYPHYFRMNRFTKVAEKHGLATMINFSGLAPTSVSHYIAKVDIKNIGKDLLEEVK